MKKLVMLLLFAILVFSCNKDDMFIMPNDELKIEQRAKKDKIAVCHNLPNGDCMTIYINANAWPAHEAHGDQLGACCLFCDDLYLFDWDDSPDDEYYECSEIGSDQSCSEWNYSYAYLNDINIGDHNGFISSFAYYNYQICSGYYGEVWAYYFDEQTSTVILDEYYYDYTEEAYNLALTCYNVIKDLGEEYTNTCGTENENSTLTNVENKMQHTLDRMVNLQKEY